MIAAPTVTQVPVSDDILEVAAHYLVDHATQLPDLTRSVVMLPDLQFAPRLRRLLLQVASGHGQSALLGPAISTPDQWLRENIPIDRTVPGRARRELLVVEVLKQHPGVLPGNDPWALAASLVTLFEELTLNRVAVPDDLDAFTRRLQEAYGIAEHLPAPLGMEARMVHTLWLAWHEELQAADSLDPGMAHLQRLAAHRNRDDGRHYCLVGFDELSAAETEWLGSLLAAGRAHCLVYRSAPSTATEPPRPLQALLQSSAANGSGDTPFDTVLDAVFESHTRPPPERALALRESLGTSPLAGRLRLFPASSAEQEALSIDLQVRQWLLDGRQPIGIVTEDRRLARRVRALLERAGISLQDSGGWALSTTSAAAAMERWLETVEEDFDHLPLLDVLKSPFIFPDDDREQLRNDVFRFEQDVVLHENIGRGLSRYRRHIDLRQQRLPDGWSSTTADAMQQLLNRLDQAAEPLRGLAGTALASPALLLQRLRSSLEELGMWSAFDGDPAGRRIQQEWQLLHEAALPCKVQMSWLEFRAWLGAALERHDFRPATANSPVQLLTLQQAQLGRYAGLVIGACDREHLPALPAAPPFFNDPVRRDLGLPVRPDHYRLQLQRFRRLLGRAPRVLMTWPAQTDGEPRMPGAWLDALQTFHRLAWQDDLCDAVLAQQVEHPASRVAGHNPLELPQPCSHPAAGLPAELLPQTISVSAHGELIDCPYQFFAARGLGLRPREAIREALEKADYGELVHFCLELFHAGHEGWPGPLTGTLNDASRDSAIALLQEITQVVFTRKVEDNFEHRAWQIRWQARIPEYIDWQIKRQPDWTFRQAEAQQCVGLGNGREMKGRLDRIDSGAKGSAIIDYKTGNPPKQADVDSGEKVQLPSYALLTATPPARVEYLKLDRKVATGAVLEGEALATLGAAVHQRLVDVLRDIDNGTPLPAWGDSKTCEYCRMDGLCRRQTWTESADSGTHGTETP
jgi:ATP-dependent helicase/nuclease subunit B